MYILVTGLVFKLTGKTSPLKERLIIVSNSLEIRSAFSLRIKRGILVGPKKVVLFREIDWVKFFYHSPMCIGECVSEYIFLI